MGAGLKFVEFLSRWVLALDVKLGPATAVSLESGGEGAGVQSASGTGGRATPIVASSSTASEKPDSFKTLLTTHTPPTTGLHLWCPKGLNSRHAFKTQNDVQSQSLRYTRQVQGCE